MAPKNENFEKMKKTLEDTIILQMFTINDSHMIYGFSDIECNRQIFLSFWTAFALLPPPLPHTHTHTHTQTHTQVKTQKIKI